MATTVDLTRASRDTISSLRTAIDQSAVASRRISTGQRVNDAFEDPASFFTAQSLTNQASELDRTLDQLGQGVQVVKAASEGLSSIDELLDAARAVVNRAGQSDDAFARANFAKSFNDLLDQMEGVARDSGYRGKNLLLGEGHDLKLYFGDEARDAITIAARDLSDVGRTLGLKRVDAGTIGVAETRLAPGGTPLAATDPAANASDQFAIGDTIEIRRQSDGALLSSVTVGADTTVSSLASSLSNADAGVRASYGADGVLRIEAAVGVTIDGGVAGGSFDGASIDATPSGWFDADATATQAEGVKSARDTLRLISVAFGTNLTMLQNRETFMKEFSGTLVTGAETTIGADLNEEGANLLALQIRQQFSSSALSFANEADQGVLRLLGG